MSAPLHAHLDERARAVLGHNRRGSWTCPSSTLYTHQWLWDSCFIAIGLAHYDPPRAAGELRSLFRGQWRNGMLPHMIFVDGMEDIGSRRIWKSKKNPLAPRDVHTSCITQPPLPAIAVWRVAQALPDADRRAFLAEMLPKLVAYHQWLYRERDPRGSGLVTLIHPWECGLDTTPPWMDALTRMPLPWWVRMVLRFRLVRLVHRLRNDTRYLPAAQRPSDGDGLRMLVLARRLEKHQFRLDRLPTDRVVLMEDLAFNAFLVAANHALQQIALDLGLPLPPALAASIERTDEALEQLWDEQSGEYYSRDATTGTRVEMPTVATFLPLWSGVPNRERAERLIARLRDGSGFWPAFPVPSVPVDAPYFREAGYWQGPTWVNVNWAIIEALRDYGHDDLADELRRQTIELVDRAGCWEYFSPRSGTGFGADDFSWTAALVIDLLARPGGSG